MIPQHVIEEHIRDNLGEYKPILLDGVLYYLIKTEEMFLIVSVDSGIYVYYYGYGDAVEVSPQVKDLIKRKAFHDKLSGNVVEGGTPQSYIETYQKVVTNGNPTHSSVPETP